MSLEMKAQLYFQIKQIVEYFIDMLLSVKNKIKTQF